MSAGLPGWAMYAGVAALAVGLLTFLLALVPRAPGPESAEERVASYTARTSRTPPKPAPRVDAESALAGARTAVAGLLRRHASMEERIARSLEGAGSELKPAEWLLVQLVVAIAGGVLGLLIGADDPVVGLLFLAVAVVTPWAWLRWRRARRRRRFAELLPETLQLMSSSLAAGLSLGQAVDAVVREGSDPIAGEFRRALVETRLGVEIEDALEGISDRFDSPDFAWVVMAIRIQHQVGGNLAELFETVAATLRERQYLRRQVGALSAEGRLSAWVIGALPPLFTLYLLVTNRPYLRPLLHDPRGVIMVIFGAVWLSIGAFWLSKLVKVEV
jgi:tight adherence protein B